jgi:hypothetical protein
MATDYDTTGPFIAGQDIMCGFSHDTDTQGEDTQLKEIENENDNPKCARKIIISLRYTSVPRTKAALDHRGLLHEERSVALLRPRETHARSPVAQLLLDAAARHFKSYPTVFPFTPVPR